MNTRLHRIRNNCSKMFLYARACTCLIWIRNLQRTLTIANVYNSQKFALSLDIRLHSFGSSDSEFKEPVLRPLAYTVVVLDWWPPCPCSLLLRSGWTCSDWKACKRATPELSFKSPVVCSSSLNGFNILLLASIAQLISSDFVIILLLRSHENVAKSARCHCDANL